MHSDINHPIEIKLASRCIDNGGIVKRKTHHLVVLDSMIEDEFLLNRGSTTIAQIELESLHLFMRYGYCSYV